jgi:hypothetical protein
MRQKPRIAAKDKGGAGAGGRHTKARKTGFKSHAQPRLKWAARDDLFAQTMPRRDEASKKDDASKVMPLRGRF